jgi:O-Antigen ligase
VRRRLSSSRNAGGTAGGGLILAAGAVAVVLGLIPGTLSVGGTIAVGLLGLGTLAIVIFRRGLGAVLPPGLLGVRADLGQVSDLDGPAQARQPDPVLRVPRLLFYLGALMVTQSSLRVALGLTFGEFFFIAAFGVTCLAVIAGRPMGSVPNALVVGLALFAFGGLISSPNAASPTSSVLEVLQAVYVMLLWVWTGATVLRSRSQFLTATTLWTVSAALNGAGALTQVLGFTALAGPLEGSRATGFTVHANDLGGACAVALVPALLLATSRFEQLSAASAARAGRWIVLGLISAGLVLSGSVTALLAAFVAILVWMFAPSARIGGRLAVITGLIVAMFAVVLVGGKVTSPTERVSQVTSRSATRQGAGTVDVRIRTVKRALARIKTDPVFGVGFDGAGGLVTVIDKGRSARYQVHSAPVAAWYEAGILGLIGLLVVAGGLARTAWHSLLGADENDLLVGLAVLAAGIAFVIIALTSPLVFQQYGWFTAVMIVAWHARRDVPSELLVATPSRKVAMPVIPPHPLPH